MKWKMMLFLLMPFCMVAYSSIFYDTSKNCSLDKLQETSPYVEMGAFKSQEEAFRFQHVLQEKTLFIVETFSRCGAYYVIMGPVNTTMTPTVITLARDISKSILSSHFKASSVTHPQRKTYTGKKYKHLHNSRKRILSAHKGTSRTHSFIKNKAQYHQKQRAMMKNQTQEPIRDVLQSFAQWFIGGQIGAYWQDVLTQFTVHNGSGFSVPFDQDIYTTDDNHAATLLSVQFGRRWSLNSSWPSSISLAAEYQYLLVSRINGEVREFSLPQFTNYSYVWKTESNLLLLKTKLNGPIYHHLSPFIQGGLGLALRSGQQYREIAFEGITPRISPDYSSYTGAHVVYVIGMGIDYQVKPSLIMSLNYQYANLGQLHSGYGTQTWNSQRLNFGQNQLQSVQLGFVYLFSQCTLFGC